MSKTYEEMIDYLTSKQTLTLYEKVKKWAKPFIRCHDCHYETNIPDRYYLERKGKDEIEKLYTHVSRVIKNLEEIEETANFFEDKNG